MALPFLFKQCLALSAAMPGLAGAIFRKNSMHAALRTFDPDAPSSVQTNNKVCICLKLFNMIASEKGPGILEKGGVFPGSVLIDFFDLRLRLKQDIVHIEMDSDSLNTDTFWPLLDPSRNYFMIITS